MLLARLPGGSVNDVWRVDTPQGRFVLRIDGPAWRRPGVQRDRELLIHGAAAAAGLAPRIVVRAPEQGILVTQFIAARHWLAADYAESTLLTRLGERLAQLHQLTPPPALTAPFAPLAIAESYAAAISVTGERARLTATLIDAVRRDAAAIAAAGVPLVMVHGDPTHGNLLGRRRLWLIDWEYAQLADPVYDVAAVLVYYPAARAMQAPLLAAAQLSGAAGDGRLAAAARIHAALGWLWQQARGELPSLEAGIPAGEWAN
jgi:thiamine kinase